MLVVAILCTHAFFLWSVRGRIERADPDFTAYYTAGKILREQEGPLLYDRRSQSEVQSRFATDSDIRSGPLSYIHPPFEAPIFIPFTYFGYGQAFVLWDCLGLAILFLILLMLRGIIGVLGRFALWQLVALSLAFFPVLANFHQGQDAILLLLVITLSFRALEQGSMFGAGCWLGAGLFRFQLTLPLFLILAIWKGRKFVAGFAFVAFMEFLISLALVGITGLERYPFFVWNVVSHPALGGLPSHRSPNLVGLLAGWSFPAKINWIIQSTVLLISVILLIWVASLKPDIRERQAFRLSLSGAIIVALLTGYVTNTYDLCLLIIPLALVADYLASDTPFTGDLPLRQILPPVFLCVSPVWFFLWMRWEKLNLVAIFLLWWLFEIRTEIKRASSARQSRPQLALS